MKTKYRRRWHADPSSIYRVMNKIQLFTPDEQAKLTVPARLSFEKIRTGIATEPDFHLLAACVNVTMILAEKIDPLAETVAVKARDAMVRCWHRFQQSGRVGFDGPALQELPDAMDLHDQLMQLLTPLQVAHAVQVVQKRMDAGEVMQ